MSAVGTGGDLMDQEKVFVLMTEKEGILGVHGAFKLKQDAVDCGEYLTEQWEYKDAGVFVLPTNLL